ncbi:MAG: FGGY family carbohydrate kinase [Anaerolineae bacterium]
MSAARRSHGCWITSPARARAERGELAFGTVDTFLIWRLTGGRLHVTDVSNASRTLLYDIHAGEWSDEILTRLNIPRAVLPESCPAATSTARRTCSAAASPSPGSRAISRRRPSGRRATKPVSPSRPTARAASCS